jgi:hypothetical protein
MPACRRLRELGLAGRILEVLTGLDLGDDWLRTVCWRNAAALFDLTGSLTGGRGVARTALERYDLPWRCRD